ncbi:methyl-accepting chemotaxis protein [Roseiterribacter gracilis]|uniref:Methyl-accepting chemotaxis protein n=1 Tax=Roseiterribacter gracilis TaxID=2812848 RepID=A0A8S8XEX6_9PROT|nr:methyl-accepting chemotaxis protein [Rhodospirillales bacterium TMPK1]
MIRAYANLRLATKLAIPLLLLALVTIFIVGDARSGMQTLGTTLHEIVDARAPRRALSLTIYASINGATVSEKNLILATEKSDKDMYEKQFRDRITEARTALDRLNALADTQSRRDTNKHIGELINAYEKVCEGSIAAVRKGDFEAARAISLGEGRKARSPLTQLLEERIAANGKEMEESKVSALATQSATERNLLLVAVVGLLAGFGAIGGVVIFLVVRPLTNMTSTMQTLASGKLEVDVVGADRKDEVGALARSLQVFKDNALEARRLTAEQEALKAKAAADQKAALNQMADSFEASVGGIVSMVASAATEMQSAAQSLATTADSASQQAAAVSAATTQTTANVQTVATAAEELSSTTSEIARQVSHSNSIANQAVDEAQATNLTVEGLATAAQKIGEVVGLIQDIASQTNLLALNATIEAARAGDAGKGFAVVASEVKALAGQTAKATEEIGAQIAAIQGATDNAVGAIKRIGGTIGQLSEISSAIAAAVEEQSAATREIASNVQQAARGTDEVATNIDGVTQSSGEVGAAASQVLGSAGELSQQSERLKVEVDQFLRTVREAA